MSDEVKCPNCGSTQVTAQKRGFSGGKAAAGVVLTGGVGALAGLHGKDKIEVHCLKCGNNWDPVEQNKRETRQRHQAIDDHNKAWKLKFYAAYESGDRYTAESILREERGAMLEEKGVEGMYNQLKATDRFERNFKVVGFLILALLIYWVISCVN